MKNEALIIVVSVDYAFWQEDLADVITIMADTFTSQPASSREIWLRGKASPRFEREVGDLGWSVRQEIDLTEQVKEKLAPPEQEKGT